jgi:hypothetical protein
VDEEKRNVTLRRSARFVRDVSKGEVRVLSKYLLTAFFHLIYIKKGDFVYIYGSMCIKNAVFYIHPRQNLKNNGAES